MDLDEFEVEYEQEKEHDDMFPLSPYLQIEEHIMSVQFKIKDFLYRTGEHDLLAYWTYDDTAKFLYQADYVDMIKKEEENPL